MSTRTLTRLALAFIVGCLAAVCLYALIRLAQALVFTEPDPAMVIWSAHAGFFWRAWTAAYGGGTAAFLAYLFADRAPERMARGALGLFVVATLLIVFQGLFVP